MSRSALVALALILPLTAGAGAAAPASSSDAKAAATWSTKRVEYGDGPVSVVRGRHRIVFDGRRGDRVTLRGIFLRKDVSTQCPEAWLVRAGESLGAPKAGLFWRLPRSGRYAFKVHNCGRGVLDGLQLTKLRSRTVGVGESARFRKERGYEYAVRVRVPRRGAVMVRTSSADRRLARGDVVAGAVHQSFDGGATDGRPAKVPNLLLEAGQPVRYLHGYFNADFFQGVMNYAPAEARALSAGSRVLVVPRADVRVAVGRPNDPSRLEVGGPGLAFTAGRKARTLRRATITSSTEQWVRLTGSIDGAPLDTQTSFLSDVRLAAYLKGPGGAEVSSPLSTLFKLPAGASELRVLANTTDGTRKRFQLRLTPVRTLPAMPTDGTPVEFATQSPGEWVLAPVTLDPTRTYRADASNVDLQPGWQALISSETRPACRDVFCNPDIGFLSEGRPSDVGLQAIGRGAGPWFALLRPLPGRSGRVSLALTPTG